MKTTPSLLAHRPLTLLCCLFIAGGAGCSSDDEATAPAGGAQPPEAAAETSADDADSEAEPAAEEEVEETESSPDATVVEVKGDVRLNGEPLTKGKVRLRGEIVVGKGRAIIELPGAGTLRLFPHTRTSLGETRTKLTVRLVVGKVWAIVTRLSGEKRFAVETENAVAGVRGTEYVVEAQKDETDVRVMKGEVRVANGAGEDQVVKTRQRSKVKGRKRPSKPQPYNPGIDRKVWDTAMTVKRDVTKGVRTIEKDVSKKINKFLP